MDMRKLAKVLALAASDNDAEAVHALRTLKRLLDGQGNDFVDLARWAEAGAQADARPARANDADALEDAVFDLRNELRRLRTENEKLRQGFPPMAAADADGGEAAQLRGQLQHALGALEVERAESCRLRATQSTMRQQFQDALSEAGRISQRLNDIDAHRARLEAENHRLSHTNHALTVQLDDAMAHMRRLRVSNASKAKDQDKPAVKRAPHVKAAAGEQIALL